MLCLNEPPGFEPGTFALSSTHKHLNTISEDIIGDYLEYRFARIKSKKPLVDRKNCKKAV